MAAILMIEPDMSTGARMREVLSREHVCQSVPTIADALQSLRSSQQMLTILNARLPWSESVELLRLLESRNWPLLFVTADPASVQHLRTLYRGMCDVLVSPFDARGLLDAVSSILTETSRLLTIGPLRMDVEAREATLDGEQLSLTAQEFALLHALMASPDATLTREELLRTAWGYQGIGETRTVDVHIQRLRRKLGASCIETVYKLGYKLKMA